MTEPTSLPPLMVAPNGARLTDDDHPAVPVTIPQIVETARRCASAGAGVVGLLEPGHHPDHRLDGRRHERRVDKLEREERLVLCAEKHPFPPLFLLYI